MGSTILILKGSGTYFGISMTPHWFNVIFFNSIMYKKMFVKKIINKININKGFI